MLLFTKYNNTWLTAISMSLLAALPAKMSAFKGLMQHNACHRQYKVNLCRFVALSLLRNKDQQ